MATITIKNGQFISGGQVVAPEFGNREQIKAMKDYLANIEALERGELQLQYDIELKATLEVTNERETSYNANVVGLVELGFLCKERDEEGVCTLYNDKYSVDIIFQEQPEDFVPYIVWPAPVGVHVFAGWEAYYQEQFCIAKPDSPYCQPPVTE
jgi:hypothetical protein